MFKLRRFNKNDILKQLDDITTPVMIIQALHVGRVVKNRTFIYKGLTVT